MSEIKTSAKGVDYADPCTLQIKKEYIHRHCLCGFHMTILMCRIFH